MNYSDHPKYDIIKNELDSLSKNLNSHFNIDRLEKYLKNVFSIHSLDQEFNISYFDALNEISIEDIGYRIAKDDKQQPEQLTLNQKVFMEFQNNFSDKIMSEKILNAIGDRTIDQALQPDMTNGEITPSPLSLLMKDKSLIKLLKDENNMLQLEKLFNALIC